jgi:hypothetical protein
MLLLKKLLEADHIGLFCTPRRIADFNFSVGLKGHFTDTFKKIIHTAFLFGAIVF